MADDFAIMSFMLPRKLPPRLAQILANASWQQDVSGDSGAKTFRLFQSGETLFLKTSGPAHIPLLQAEAEKIEWLTSHLPVAQLRYFETTAEGAFLLMTAIPGVNITYFNHQSDEAKKRAISILVEGLHQLHGLPVTTTCPFNNTLSVQLERAQQRLTLGLVDDTNFDKERLGQQTADLFNELIATRPDKENIVFTHGDYCLPNIIVADDRLSGFIDLGRAGLADRYQDLALCTRSLTRNFGPGWEELFWHQYALIQPDAAKLAYYRLLDEFF